MMRRLRAVSLIEVILAVTVLGMALTLLVGLIPSAGLSSRMARSRTLAGNLAQDVLENIDFSNAAAMLGGTLDPITREDIEFRRRIERNPLPPPSTAVRLRVVVSWKHGKTEREVFREMVVSDIRR